MSTVARAMKELLNRAEIKADIINLIDFYLPLRGSMRRNRSHSGSLMGDDKDKEANAKIE